MGSANQPVILLGRVRFSILAKQEVIVFNYIDNIYVCCHVYQATEPFKCLNKVISEVGLPINPDKVFPPTTVLSIMGIVIDVSQVTFSIEEKKLSEIHTLCLQAFLSEHMTKREFQSVLGKLLYIATFVKSSRIFFNHLLMTLRTHNNKSRICLDTGAHES